MQYISHLNKFNYISFYLIQLYDNKLRRYLNVPFRFICETINYISCSSKILFREKIRLSTKLTLTHYA